MTICTIVGARPQFIKAASVSRTLSNAGVEELLVHTGQHYDEEMSHIFFHELAIPRPSINLDVGSGSHAYQTGEIMVRLEEYLRNCAHVDWLIVYGDTNSTLAGALTAAKLGIPVAHVEAGLRSFNRAMPEEINRIVADRLSGVLFCPTATAVGNLAAEGITEGVVLTGDVMFESTRLFSDKASDVVPISTITNHEPSTYFLATIHRAENTDDPERLTGIFDGLKRLDAPVIVPLHPRTRAALRSTELPNNVEVIKPVGYFQMLSLLKHAAAVLTDSGGVQKEAYWLEVPCITLRNETEWVETLHGGWNRLVGADPDAIQRAAATPPTDEQIPFGEAPDGLPSEVITRELYTDRALTTDNTNR